MALGGDGVSRSNWRRVFKSSTTDRWTVMAPRPLDVDDSRSQQARPVAYFYERDSWGEAMEVALNVPFKPGTPWKPAPSIESTGV